MSFKKNLALFMAWIFLKIGLTTRKDYENYKFNVKFLFILTFVALIFLPVYSEAKAFTNATHNILWVYGNQNENLSSISRQVGNASLQRLSGSPNVYVLFEMMVFNDTRTNATFSSRVDGAYELRLNGSKGIIFTAFSGPEHMLNLTGIKLRTWNNVTGNEIPSTAIPKGFIHFSSRKALFFAKNLTTSNLGNSTVNFRGITILSSTGSKILNSNISGGNMGLQLRNTLTNKTIINNTLFHNQSGQGIYIQKPSDNNISFSNFTSQVIAINFESNTGRRNRVFKNYFYNPDSTLTSFIVHKSNNLTQIYLNNFRGDNLASTFESAILIGSSRHLRIYNNTYNFTQYGITIQSLSKYINLTWNRAFNNDQGLGRIKDNSSYIRIYNNTIKNSTFSYDGYDMGLKLNNASFIWILDNNFTELSSTGISIQAGHNISIKDNSFEFIDFGLRSLYSSRDTGSPPVAILISPLYKSFLGEGLETGCCDALAYINKWESDNIMIRTNTFDSDTMVILKLRGASNVDYDFTNYWFRSFQAPIWQIARDWFYISNNFNNLSSYNLGQRDILSNSYNGYNKAQWKINYTISKYAMSFINLNFTNSSYRAIALFNVSGYKIINITNGTVLTLNSGATFNISALPGRKIVAFNGTPTVTEGIVGFFDTGNRIIGNNIYFSSSSTSTLKKIASNLSQAINATVRINVAHTNIKDIIFINNNSRDYSPDTWNFVGGQVEMTLNNIIPNSNTVYIDYGTQPLGQQQTIKGRGILRYITEELPINAFGSQYSLPAWVVGIGIISLGILALGLFTPISFPLVLILIVVNALLIWVTLS